MSSVVRHPFIMGNWKMHGSLNFVHELLQKIKPIPSQDLRNEKNHNAANPQIILFPPFVYLQKTAEELNSSGIQWGGQNICSQGNQGAYTGEISASMLKDMGCDYVLIGHSERRQYYHESNQTVLEKFLLASAAGLKSVLCVGETLEEYRAEQTQEKVLAQVESVIKSPRALPYLNLLSVAYEPVWAIGTGLTSSPEHAQNIHQFIRECTAKVDEVLASKMPILYGGSVNAGNAAELFKMPDIDGGLIGGASLKSEEFQLIYQAMMLVRSK